MQAVNEFVPGDQIGNFAVVSMLGTGGMGSIYLAQHRRSGHRVALKVLHPQLASDPKELERFEAESCVLNLARHPNIVEVLDIDVLDDGRPYYVMEYLEGRSLVSLTGQPVPAQVALPILVQVCRGLGAAHGAGVVHRDLKPQNIFLTRHGESEAVKLLDFGTAKVPSPVKSFKTTMGALIGTPEYMAPEQCQGAAVDGRADVYAVGMISYYLATGVHPFAGLPLTQILLAQVNRLPEPPHVVARTVSREWSEVTMKAIAKDPAARHQSAEELAKAFEAVPR